MQHTHHFDVDLSLPPQERWALPKPLRRGAIALLDIYKRDLGISAPQSAFGPTTGPGRGEIPSVAGYFRGPSATVSSVRTLGNRQPGVLPKLCHQTSGVDDEG
jgi:hypothetical protein